MKEFSNEMPHEMAPEPIRMPPTPDEYSGWNLTIDDMDPVFADDGTVRLYSGPMAYVLTEGAVIRMSSKEPGRQGFARVLSVDMANGTIKVEVLGPSEKKTAA